MTSGDGYMQFTGTPGEFTYRMAGLSHGDADLTYPDIDYAIFIAYDQVYVYEDGNPKFGPVSYAYGTGATFKVAVESGVVKYYMNSTLLYTSTATPTYPLVVDTALDQNASTIASTVISGSLSGGSNQAPTAVITGPSTGTPGQSLTFDGTSSSDLDGTIASYAWTINGTAAGNEFDVVTYFRNGWHLHGWTYGH